jgi:centromere protein C
VKYSVDEDLRIPVVVGVVRRAKTPQKPKVRPAQRKTTTQQTKRRKQVESDLEDSGYTPDVHVTAKVMDYDTHEEEERLLAISADQHTPEVVKGEKFAISTVFEEGTFLTAGILSFPPTVTKPSRNSAKHALVFYVINGVFQVTINQASFVIGTGGQFIVPRGNHYQLKNLHDQESKLHFCHCKDSREE